MGIKHLHSQLLLEQGIEGIGSESCEHPCTPNYQLTCQCRTWLSDDKVKEYILQAVFNQAGFSTYCPMTSLETRSSGKVQKG